MIRRQTRSTRTDTLFPETKRFRSCRGACRSKAPCGADRPTKALRHDIRLTYRSSMSKLPPLAAIRAFESAGRLENFSRAAEKLGMTQDLVRYQIRHLEDRLGREQFVRAMARDRKRTRLNSSS